MINHTARYDRLPTSSGSPRTPCPPKHLLRQIQLRQSAVVVEQQPLGVPGAYLVQAPMPPYRVSLYPRAVYPIRQTVANEFCRLQWVINTPKSDTMQAFTKFAITGSGTPSRSRSMCSKVLWIPNCSEAVERPLPSELPLSSIGSLGSIARPAQQGQNMVVWRTQCPAGRLLYCPEGGPSRLCRSKA